MSAMHIGKHNFFREVMESEKPVLLDFWASWCAPCQMVIPIMDEIARENPDIKVVKVNIDEEYELAKQYGVFSIPALFVFKNGEVTGKAVGVRNKEQLLAMIG